MRNNVLFLTTARSEPGVWTIYNLTDRRFLCKKGDKKSFRAYKNVKNIGSAVMLFIYLQCLSRLGQLVFVYVRVLTLFRNVFGRSTRNLNSEKKCPSVLLKIINKLGIPILNTKKRCVGERGTKFCVDWNCFKDILSLCAMTHPKLKQVTSDIKQFKP